MKPPTANPTKSLSKPALALYLLVLLWLVLFKTSYDVLSVILHYHSRSLNLIPFAGSSSGSAREMIDNLVVFVPFGLLLGVNLKRATFWRKLAIVFSFSLAVEALQFILAIGTSDITDVITNTAGGLIGLILYDAASKHGDHEKLDRRIAVTIMSILLILVLFRIFLFRVRY